MFKWRIYIYKNMDWKKEELSKNFDNEEDFNKFMKNNPSFNELEKFDIKKLSWPKLLFSSDDY